MVIGNHQSKIENLKCFNQSTIHETNVPLIPNGKL
jgi:hypothetical protein